MTVENGDDVGDLLELKYNKSSFKKNHGLVIAAVADGNLSYCQY
jgi:hypothetical protein